MISAATSTSCIPARPEILSADDLEDYDEVESEGEVEGYGADLVTL